MTQSLRHVYHTDAVGSVGAMTDSGQQTAKSYSYEAFGKIRSETGNLLANRYTFGGREAMGDSLGLYYNRWRIFDPNVGRFMSGDPLSFIEGPNVHLYCGNSPIKHADRLGLKCQCDIGVLPTGMVGPCKKGDSKEIQYDGVCQEESWSDLCWIKTCGKKCTYDCVEDCDANGNKVTRWKLDSCTDTKWCNP